MINHVVSLETAKKLKDYLPEGFSGKFYWWEYDYAPYSNDDCKTTPEYGLVYMNPAEDKIEDCVEISHHERNSRFISAPILSELLTILSHDIHHIDDSDYLTSHFVLNKLCVGYKNGDTFIQAYGHGTKRNPATAAAQLLCWCGEQGHLGGDDENSKKRTR